jgi:hypothetical protein
LLYWGVVGGGGGGGGGVVGRAGLSHLLACRWHIPMCGPPSITTQVGLGFIAYEAVLNVEPWVLEEEWLGAGKDARYIASQLDYIPETRAALHALAARHNSNIYRNARCLTRSRWSSISCSSHIPLKALEGFTACTVAQNGLHERLTFVVSAVSNPQARVVLRFLHPVVNYSMKPLRSSGGLTV